MIRATVVSAVDQALLSGLNFGLAFVLIHFATKHEYGLYSQLFNLQSFFSPLHAGVFVSAYLALASKMEAKHRVIFRTSMARAEIATTVLSAVAVIAICSIGATFFGSALTVTTCVAFGVALMGLWWREFIRITQFTELKYNHALQVDATYCVATVVATTVVATTLSLTVTAVFWCMAFGAAVATAVPMFAVVRGVPVNAAAIRRDVLVSWKVGRWDVLASIVTWAYAQSYVYFAAAHGGLDAAAEISAGRLLAAPLALMWVAYSNVLRPKASRLLASGPLSELRRLAERSALFVLASSLVYALLMLVLIPVLERSLFGGKFQHLRPLMICWTVYIALTGISTVASSILRSALEFRRVFHLYVISCIAAVVLLTVSTRFTPIESLVIALILVEAISAALFWHRLNLALSLHRQSV